MQELFGGEIKIINIIIIIKVPLLGNNENNVNKLKGNNGGDGLVCARHLKLFGYNVTICYPKRTDKEIYKRLLNQCVEMDIEVIKNYEGISAEDIRKNYALVVDALFGFGFRGPLRAPFDSIIKELTDSKVKLCSIDVPSGWNIDSEEGSVGNESLIQPTMLISLTAPKLCSKNFKNCHYLAGRFLPPKLEKDFNLNLPCTPPGKLFMKI
ncbi:NAD(P)H-hydrate epimerase-like [Zophobas morio]|uniref:NAD(P)H-hydrate epimerase-like n=1 Tax=Zophobas morio TaxID=2755281 RepID=UPI0030831AA2